MRPAFTGVCKNIYSVMEYLDIQLLFMRRNQSLLSHNAQNRGWSEELQTTTGTAQRLQQLYQSKRLHQRAFVLIMWNLFCLCNINETCPCLKVFGCDYTILFWLLAESNAQYSRSNLGLRFLQSSQEARIYITHKVSSSFRALGGMICIAECST